MALDLKFTPMRCPKSDWAEICPNHGQIRALLRGESYHRSCSTFWWMGSQSQRIMPHQESSCPDVSVRGSQPSCTLMTWSLPPSHHLTSKLPSMPSPDGVFSFASFGVGPTKSAMVFGPRRRVPECHVQLGGVSLLACTSNIWSAESTVCSHSACLGATVSICQSTWHPRFSPFMFSNVTWGCEFFAQSPSALRLMDNALWRWDAPSWVACRFSLLRKCLLRSRMARR